jgi:hypothetical protein
MSIFLRYSLIVLSGQGPAQLQRLIPVVLGHFIKDACLKSEVGMQRSLVVAPIYDRVSLRVNTHTHYQRPMP